MKFLFATAPDRESLAGAVENARARIAFYASTPAYRPAFAIHGLGELADRLKDYSKAQRWEEMPAFISDEVLETFVVVGTHDEIAAKIRDRYGDVVTGVEFSIAVKTEENRRALARIVETLRSVPRPQLG
jgi:alkanesulfonate monooxygenase SsuD/methylene tetrahydromethanopterin reductase-like flavin-dependent oxidoreductase (luciferase family)